MLAPLLLMSVAYAGGCPVDRVARRALPAIVRIDFELWEEGPADVPPPMRRPMLDTGRGTGFVIDADGTVLTAAHVVRGGALRSLTAHFADGREAPLRVVGVDPYLDVAVLALPPGRWEPLELGRSDGLEAGDPVVIIGWPLAAQPTVASGILSAIHVPGGPEERGDWLQTDAAFNHGTSGGPLLDCRDRVIGIASFVKGGESLGFASPIGPVLDRLDELVATGRVERGALGVVLQEVDPLLGRALGVPEARGAVVAREWEGYETPLDPGDVVLAVDGVPVPDPAFLADLASERAPGDTLALEVWRAGAPAEVSVPLVRDPSWTDPDYPAWAGPPAFALAPLREGWSARTGVTGARVSDVAPGITDLHEGDVITEVAGRAVASPEEAWARIADAGEVVLLRVWRQGGPVFVGVEHPPAPPAAEVPPAAP